MASTSGPSNRPGKQNDTAALASRCDQLRCENQMLRRALRKEREKCQFITSAYRQLLQQFDELADLKTMMELSTSSSTPSGSGSEEGGDGNRHKSRKEARVVPGRTHSGLRIGDKEEEKRRKTKRQEQGGPKRQEQGGPNDPNDVGRTLFRMSLEGNKENMGTEHGEKLDYPPKQRRQYEIVPQRSSVSVHDMTSSDFHISPIKKANERANWYFVPLKEATNIQQDDKMEHIRDLFKRSQERCEAIREASCIRAQISANRRAVVADLLTGRRALDSEAFNVLHSDSSRVVSAFPDQFMRDRRSASRRSYDRSPVRKEQERERQRQFEGAVNRILAHSSATMSKMMTVNKSRTTTNNRVAPFRI